MLPIGEKIRTLRVTKKLTQSDLADALGVTFQSVSRWENSQAYPDIELIPKIAAFFGVTTDELLIADEETKERELDALYLDYCMAVRVENDPQKRLAYRMETYRKFPKEDRRGCHIASDICKSLVETKILPRDEALPIVRELTALLLNQNTDPIFHNWALRNIYRYEDEDKLPDWQKYVGKYMTEPELLELRYLYLNEYDRHNRQVQLNLYKSITHAFPIHAHKHFADNTETARAAAEAAEFSLKLFDILRDTDNDTDIFLRHRAWTYLYLAKSKFRLGETDAAYTALEKSADLCELLFSLPPEQVRTCTHPCFDLLTVSGKSRMGGEECDYAAEADYLVFGNAFNARENQWRWFKPYLEEPRYQAILERVKKLNPTPNQKVISQDEMKELVKNGAVTASKTN